MSFKRFFSVILKMIIVVVFVVILGGVLMKNIIMPKVLYPQNYRSYVEKYADEYGLDESLVYAVIKCESNFNSQAISHKDARGLMQISEMTGIWASEVLEIKDYNSDMLYEPDVNIHIGCWYLDKLIDQFGDENTAVAAYNAGSGNVSKWLMEEKHSSDGVSLDLIPFQETEKYVKKVEMTKKIYNYLYNN